MDAVVPAVTRHLFVHRSLEQVEPHFANFLRGSAASDGFIALGQEVDNPAPNFFARNIYLGPERLRLPTIFELRATGPNATEVVLTQCVPAHMACEIQDLTEQHNFDYFTEVLTAFCDRQNGLDMEREVVGF